MDKKLEARIARLEKLLSNRNIKNEDFDALNEFSGYLQELSNTAKTQVRLIGTLIDMVNNNVSLNDNIPQRTKRELEELYSDLTGIERRIREIRY